MKTNNLGVNKRKQIGNSPATRATTGNIRWKLDGMGERKHYDLMTGVRVPPCAGGGKHLWANVLCPPCSRSGLCEDLCLTCGVSVGYDTSD